MGNVDAAVKEVRGRGLMIAVGIRIRNGTINLPQASEEARLP
jgi:acetylornithine/succinyldiaminopimelate/putrescine aminotransferase